MSEQYCYSWDDEVFNNGTFPTVEAALADAIAENDDEHSHVFIGEAVPYTNCAFFPDADTIIEYMQERADDEVGEYADCYIDVDKEAEEELTKQLKDLLFAWCEKHQVSPTFYRVKNSEAHQLP